MDQWLLLALAKHLARKEYLTLPGGFWATFAFEGAEVPGVTRVAVTYDDPEVLSESEVRWANLTDVAFTNTPDAEVDEVWVLDAAAGGRVWFRIPKLVTLVDGGSKVFRPGALAHILTDTTA
ncbi:MAG TPA: hypothetical protein VFL73_10720 [Solirubrobacteraceae bacterium]|nr:hypothetical protein [Solirubrobacteraceae bacterium]